MFCSATLNSPANHPATGRAAMINRPGHCSPLATVLPNNLVATKIMKQPFQISRRSFLQKSTLAAAATGLPLWFVQRELAAAEVAKTISSPNDRPGIALIGCGGMGQGDAENASRFGDILAVCDVDQRHVDAAAQRFTKNGRTPAKYGDFRKLLERDNIHAIVQATPDHWHTIINLAAAKAKKDVYGEKPL